MEEKQQNRQRSSCACQCKALADALLNLLQCDYIRLHALVTPHSSCTCWQVVSMKLECDPESFVSDPEGVQLTSQINKHLHEEVISWLGPLFCCCVSNALLLHDTCVAVV